MGICFEYMDDCVKYADVIEMPLASCLCKHVLNIKSPKAKAVKEESLRVGYAQVQWGYEEKFESNENQIMQLGRISRIIYKKNDRPIRIVIGCNGEIWADNLHHTIAYIIDKGFDITINEISAYIVDMRNENMPVLIDKDQSVSRDLNAILGSIESAAKRCSNVSQEIIDLHYTVREFMADNVLDRSEFPFLN